MIHTLHRFTTGYVCAILTPGNLIASSYTSSTLRTQPCLKMISHFTFLHSLHLPILSILSIEFKSLFSCLVPECSHPGGLLFCLISPSHLNILRRGLFPQGIELQKEKQPGRHKRFESVAFGLILELNLSLEFTLP